MIDVTPKDKFNRISCFQEGGVIKYHGMTDQGEKMLVGYKTGPVLHISFRTGHWMGWMD
jgi:hypothetical protein